MSRMFRPIVIGGNGSSEPVFAYFGDVRIVDLIEQGDWALFVILTGVSVRNHGGFSEATKIEAANEWLRRYPLGKRSTELWEEWARTADSIAASIAA